MSSKITYNQLEPKGQILYITDDDLIAFEYEYYSRKRILAINIPLNFHKAYRHKSETVLTEIAKYVQQSQPEKSYYTITETHIEIKKQDIFSQLNTWSVYLLLSLLSFALGYYFYHSNIDFTYRVSGRRDSLGKNHLEHITWIPIFVIAIYFFMKAYILKKKIDRKIKHK